MESAFESFVFFFELFISRAELSEEQVSLFSG